MPLDVVKMSLAVQGGLSVVCASCVKYWVARDKDMPGDTCTAKEGCAGPIAGKDFPEYEGPITDLSRWCFICSEVAKYGVATGTNSRVIGVCEEHIHKLESLRPMSDIDIHVRHDIKSAEGDTTIANIQGTPKKSLSKAISEAESYFDGKNGTLERREELEYLTEKNNRDSQ